MKIDDKEQKCKLFCAINQGAFVQPLPWVCVGPINQEFAAWTGEVKEEHERNVGFASIGSMTIHASTLSHNN